MTKSHRRKAQPVWALVGLALALTGCATSSSSRAEGTQATSTTLTPSTETTALDGAAAPIGSEARAGDNEEGATTSALQATSDALRAFVEESEDIPPNVASYVTSASDQDLEDLAATACALIEPDMSKAELGTATHEARDGLSDDDQDLLDIADFGVVFGATAGLACPERLPVGVDPPPKLRNQGLIDSYREAVPTLWSPDHPASRFVTGIGDDRLHELQASACRFSATTHSPAEFGTVVIAHYSAELTSAERSAIGTADYPEVYGSLVGWFCPDRLPSID